MQAKEKEVWQEFKQRNNDKMASKITVIVPFKQIRSAALEFNQWLNSDESLISQFSPIMLSSAVWNTFQKLMTYMDFIDKACIIETMGHQLPPKTKKLISKIKERQNEQTSKIFS